MSQQTKHQVEWDFLSYNRKEHLITAVDSNSLKFSLPPHEFIKSFEIVSPKSISLKVALMQTLERKEKISGKKFSHLKMTLLIPSEGLTEEQINALFVNDGTRISVEFGYLPFEKDEVKP